MQTITNIDLRLLNWIHEHLACSFLDFLMPKITFLGNGGLIWIAAIIMIFFQKISKNRNHDWNGFVRRRYHW